MSVVNERPSDVEVDVGKSSEDEVEKSSDEVGAGELSALEVEKTDERIELRSEVNESNNPPPPVVCGVVEVAVVVTSLSSLAVPVLRSSDVVVDELLSTLSDELVVAVGSIGMSAMYYCGPT
jgi:hypothetical protein